METTNITENQKYNATPYQILKQNNSVSSSSLLTLHSYYQMCGFFHTKQLNSILTLSTKELVSDTTI